MEVTNKNDKQFFGSWSISGDRLYRIYPKKSIKLKDNLRSIKVLSHSGALSGSDGLTRAAAGAVLGFLVAGPLGTVLGAGAGAGGAKRGKSETYSVISSFNTGEVILADATPFELETLRSYLPIVEAAPSSEQSPPSSPTPVAGPAEPRPKGGLPPAIKGRKTKRKPFAAAPLVHWLDDFNGDRATESFKRHLGTALDSLNTIKWRHFDQEVRSENELKGCLLLALSVTVGLAKDEGWNIEDGRQPLERLLAGRVTEKEFSEAWSHPLLSATMSNARAEKIIKVAHKEVAGEPKPHADPNRSRPISELEDRLLQLRDLRDRGVIDEDEFKLARAKALGV